MPRTRQPGWETSDPSLPQGGAQALHPLNFPISTGFLSPGPSLRVGWVGVLRKEGVEPLSVPEAYTPVGPSASSLSAALDFQLSQKPIFAELALNKDLKMQVNKIQTFIYFTKLSKEFQPLC